MWASIAKPPNTLCTPSTPTIKHNSKSFDLGQFERFRRILHIPAYKPLLNHEECQIMSTLQVRVRGRRLCVSHVCAC